MPTYAIPGAGDPLRSYYLNSTPDAAFYEYLQRAGFNGLRPVDQFARNSQARLYNTYQAAIADEPNLGFWDYLNRERPDFQRDYLSQSPGQRGDSSNRFLVPRARFVNAY